MKEDIQTTRLGDGLTILTDRMPDVRSATLGFFFNKGSRHEPDELNGISHFIEHTVFKGSKNRSALQIAIETDRLGGNLDAFTTHEETGFAIKVIDNQVATAFELIADMLTNPLFYEKELKSERKVIIEELKMTEDSPEEYLGDLFSEKFFPHHPLGMSIAGTPKTVKSFSRDITRSYFEQIFNPSNLVIAAAGNIEHSQIVDLAESFFATSASGRQDAGVPSPQFGAPIIVKQNKNLEQAHLILAVPFVGAADERRYAADLLSGIIGGGTSSRLWQKVREQRGLAYSVGASTIMFRDCGFFSIYAATSPKQTEEVVDLAVAELRSVLNDGVSAEELALVKQQTIASVLLGLEDSASRAASLAHSEMLHGRQIPLEETLAKLEAVTSEEIDALAKEFFKTERIAFAALGNLNGVKIKREQLRVS
ncbi:MAG: insulinase family protein [Saprospiraceae bacterium]|nr:insulinase family protein [Pyrinomonadaceae bacterium]